jgi:peptidoglycan/LPS O-acetylase OafA/YrhL
MIIISVVVIVIIICSFQVLHINRENECSIEDGYSIEKTNAIKGILALCILLSHLTGRVDYEIPILGFSAMGAMGVGAFFFFSGYGLNISLIKNAQYGKKFLIKRLIKVLVPLFTMTCLYTIVSEGFGNGNFTYVLYRLKVGDPVSNSWYVYAIVFCYLLYALGCKLFSRKTNQYFYIFLFCGIGIAFYIGVVAFLLKWPDWWYKTIECFLIGLLLGWHKKRISSVIQNKYFIILGLALISLAISYFFPAICHRIFHTQLNNIWLWNDILMGISFTITLGILIHRVQFDNVVTRFLGNISYEVYLLHGLIMDVLLQIGGAMLDKYLRKYIAFV